MSFEHENFDELAAKFAQLEGMELAAERRKELLKSCRALAVYIASRRPSRECHIDDVYRALKKLNVDVLLLGPAAGSVFKTNDWEYAGRWKESLRISNHKHASRVWRLKKPETT